MDLIRSHDLDDLNHLQSLCVNIRGTRSMKWNFLIPDKHNWQEGSSLSFPMASEEYSRHKKNAWWCASSPSYNLSHSLHRPPTPAFQLLKCSAILPTTTPFKSSETHSKMISCAVLTKSQGTTDQHHLFTAHVFRKIMLPADSFHFQLLFPPPQITFPKHIILVWTVPYKFSLAFPSLPCFLRSLSKNY